MKIITILFSPTGGTKKIATVLAQSISDYLGSQASEILEMDITLPSARATEISIEKDDFAILAFPTYAGKLPNKILPDIKNIIKGNRGSCVCVTTFGNRNFQNSLAELTHIALEANLCPIGAAAFVCEHPFSKKLGTDRPDLLDLAELSLFARNIADKLAYSPEEEVLVALGLMGSEKLKSIENNYLSDTDIPGAYDSPYYIPKKIDGTQANFLKAKVKTNPNLCDGCGLCTQRCPISSISEDDPTIISGPCIKCHACIKVCPKNAKFFDDEDFLSHVQYLEKNHQERKTNKFYYSTSSGKS